MNTITTIKLYHSIIEASNKPNKIIYNTIIQDLYIIKPIITKEITPEYVVLTITTTPTTTTNINSYQTVLKMFNTTPQLTRDNDRCIRNLLLYIKTISYFQLADSIIFSAMSLLYNLDIYMNNYMDLWSNDEYSNYIV